MKSCSTHVTGWAMGVACLALLLNRPTQADEKKEPAKKDHQIVVRVQKDDVKKADVKKADADVADAIKRALHEKMENMPESIKARLQKKLQEVQKAHTTSARVEHIRRAVSASKLEHATKVAGEHVHSHDGIEKEVEVHVQVDGKGAKNSGACPMCGSGKAMAFAIGVDQEGDSKGHPRVFTVRIDGNQIKVEGQPHAGHASGLAHVVVAKKGDGDHKDAEHKVQVRRIEIRSDDKDGPKTMSVKGHAIFVGEDGKARTVDLSSPKNNVIITSDGDKKQVQARVMVVRPDQKSTAFSVGKRVKAPVHAAHGVAALRLSKAAKAPSDVAKRLKTIEAELKQIRRLVERLKDDDDDDDDD